VEGRQPKKEMVFMEQSELRRMRMIGLHMKEKLHRQSKEMGVHEAGKENNDASHVLVIDLVL